MTATLEESTVTQTPPPVRAATITTPPSQQASTVKLKRFTVEDYHKMCVAGILDGSERTELINGLVVKKMAKDHPHVLTLKLLLRWMIAHLPAGTDYFVQEPVKADRSEPEPDFTVVNRDAMSFVSEFPSASDAPLVVEVSDSTVRQDRGVKMRMYARSEFPEYWVVNLPAMRIEVYTGPEKSGYREYRWYSAGETITFTIAGVELSLPVADILSPTSAQ